MRKKLKLVILLLIISFLVALSFLMIYPDAYSSIMSYLHGKARLTIDLVKDWITITDIGWFCSTRFSLTYTIVAFVSAVTSCVCVAYLIKNLLEENKTKRNQKTQRIDESAFPISLKSKVS